MTRPSPEIAGSRAGAFGWAPEGVRARRNWGCRAAVAGDATAMAAAAAIGNARSAKRLRDDIGTKSFRVGGSPSEHQRAAHVSAARENHLRESYPPDTLHDR